MSNALILISSFSILIPAFISWVRFKQIHPTYHPFIFCLWIGCLNEVISYLVTINHYSNALSSNIYVLLEGGLILWQFERWGNFTRKEFFFIFFLVLFVAVWVGENFFISRITYFSSYFRIFYAAVLSLMSINFINSIIVRERRSILRNASFLMCAGFILYYTYKVMVEAFWIYGLNNGSSFRINVYLILMYINLLVNLIFAQAVLWIPTKQRFTLPS